MLCWNWDDDDDVNEIISIEFYSCRLKSKLIAIVFGYMILDKSSISKCENLCVLIVGEWHEAIIHGWQNTQDLGDEPTFLLLFLSHSHNGRLQFSYSIAVFYRTEFREYLPSCEEEKKSSSRNVSIVKISLHRWCVDGVTFTVTNLSKHFEFSFKWKFK